MKKPKLFIAALVATLTLSGCDLVGLPSFKDVLDYITGNHEIDPETGNNPDNTDDNPITYTVTFTTDKGTVEGGNIKTVEVGTSITLPNATATGYELLGWALESGATSKDLSVGFTFTVNSDITLYAVWKEQQTVVNVTSVSLDKHTLTLDVNETEVLTATVQPENAANKAVTWTSSNTSVATVSNGTVTAKAAGSATIKVKTKDGNKEDSCVVTVTSPGPVDNTITPEQAVTIIDGLELNVVSEKEYLVKGIVASGAELDQNGFNGSFLNSSLKFRSVKPNGKASTVDDIIGKEVVIKGYLENYNSIYQIPYLPAYASPTGSKYNATLMSVASGGQEETVEVTQVLMSPVNKTLTVGETSTLSVTVMPQNASNKNVSWTSTNSSVCSVTQTGVIKGLGAGTAIISATSNNGISAECYVTVNASGGEQLDGDTFAIEFKKFESDGQTPLTESTVLEQITSGSNYIDEITDISQVYKGQYGLKFGSRKTGGSLYFELSSALKNVECKQIIIEPSQYGTNSTTVSIYGDEELIKSGSSSDAEIVATLSSPKKISEVGITVSSRAYISKITIICGESTPIPVTAISIPSTKAISTGNDEILSVTYTPSNANTGKGITWSTNNSSVATVISGVVHGVAPGTATITATSEGGLTATCAVTVSNVAVTGVTLSSTSETIGIGSTKQLTETVLPYNATNKNVTWSSSNTNVVSVSSTGLVTAKAVGTATITVKTAEGNKQATCSITVQEQQNDAWTIMIYMCGADLESENGLATGDIKEILSVNNQPENVNILIETGGAKSWSLSSTYLSGATKIDPSKLSRWHVKNKKLVLDETLTYASMGLSSTLQSFVEWGIKEYPAEKTGVIFWNHGGAMYGCCYDEKKNDDSLVNSEMKTAFSKALTNTGSSKLEFVGYDTCLTQVQDIAEFNSNYFNYMIASEEAEAGEGWDYDTWVDDLYANKPTETILKAIVDGFINDNGGASSTKSDQTLSFLDLNQMPAYKAAFESFASALKSKLSSGSVTKATFAKWMDSTIKAFCVDSDEDEAYYCLFDVKDMLNKLSSNSSYNPGSTYISNLQTAFTNLVKYSVAQKGAGNAYGLGCIYCQSSTYSSYIKSAYTATETNFSNWLSFCKTYSYLA